LYLVLGDYAGSGSSSSIDKNPGGLLSTKNGMAMGSTDYDMVANFDQGTDKIKIFDTNLNPISSFTAAGLTVDSMGGGNYLVFTAGNDIVFGIDVAINDSDLTTV